MIEQAMTGREHPRIEVVEVDHEALRVEILRHQADLELPGMTVDRDTRARVTPDVMGEVDVNAGSDFVHRALSRLAAAREPAGQVGGQRSRRVDFWPGLRFVSDRPDRHRTCRAHGSRLVIPASPKAADARGPELPP